MFVLRTRVIQFFDLSSPYEKIKCPPTDVFFREGFIKLIFPAAILKKKGTFFVYCPLAVTSRLCDIMAMTIFPSQHNIHHNLKSETCFIFHLPKFFLIVTYKFDGRKVVTRNMRQYILFIQIQFFQIELICPN